ncbi:MAG: hypothetical protein KC766_01430, partial [Myxococcales bacterium]|nr:hypothetical protein [Myxococcales bacterium]
MTDIDILKLDVRVRERLFRKGQLASSVVDAHVATLQDLESQCEPVSIAQPALAPRDEEERAQEREAAQAARAAAAAQAAPAAAPTPTFVRPAAPPFGAPVMDDAFGPAEPVPAVAAP